MEEEEEEEEEAEAAEAAEAAETTPCRPNKLRILDDFFSGLATGVLATPSCSSARSEY